MLQLTLPRFRTTQPCMRQGSANERYRNTVKDLLPTTVKQKDEKPHTTGLYGYRDTAHFLLPK